MTDRTVADFQTVRREIKAAALEGIGMTPFLYFWAAINDMLRHREQPEMLYGEARRTFISATNLGWRER